jgi:hypothetical protein
MFFTGNKSSFVLGYQHPTKRSMAQNEVPTRVKQITSTRKVMLAVIRGIHGFRFFDMMPLGGVPTPSTSVLILWIIKQIQLFFETALSLNTMLHSVKPMLGLKTVKAVPMERTRVMADENAIGAYYERLVTFLLGIPRAFIVSAVESGFADYTNPLSETVLVPADYPLDYIDIPTDRHIKRSTLVAAILAGAPARKVRHWREAPHIEEGMGSAGKGRVHLVEKPRPNSYI